MALINNLRKHLLLTALVLFILSGRVYSQDNCNKTIITNDYRQEGRYLKINFTFKGCPSNYKFDIKRLVVTDLNMNDIIPKSLSGDTTNLPADKKNELVWDVINDVDMLDEIKSITIFTDYSDETKKLIEAEALRKVKEVKLKANSAGWVGGVHRFNVGLCFGLGAMLPSYNFIPSSNITSNPKGFSIFAGLSNRILFAKFVGFQFDFIIQTTIGTAFSGNYNISSALDFNVPLTFNFYFLRVLEFKTGIVFNKMIRHEETYEASYNNAIYYDETYFKDDILFDVGLGLHVRKRAEWVAEYQRSIVNLANSASLPFTNKYNNKLLFHFRFFFLR